MATSTASTIALASNATNAGASDSRAWRWLAAVAVFGNIALTYWSRIWPLNGQSMGYVSGKYPTLLTPAGYAFSIWGLIFLALAAYAGWQLRPAQRTNLLPDAVARQLTVASAATAAWVVLFAYERINLCTLAMVTILVALISAYGRARRLVLVGAAPRWTSAPFALYLGWISVASVINVTLSLRLLGWTPEQNIALLLALVLLMAVVTLGLVISQAFEEITYPVVLAWALVAVWVAHRSAYPELGWAALAGAAIVGVGGVVLALKARRNY